MLKGAGYASRPGMEWRLLPGSTKPLVYLKEGHLDVEQVTLP